MQVSTLTEVMSEQWHQLSAGKTYKPPQSNRLGDINTGIAFIVEVDRIFS